MGNGNWEIAPFSVISEKFVYWRADAITSTS